MKKPKWSKDQAKPSAQENNAHWFTPILSYFIGGNVALLRLNPKSLFIH